MKVYSLKQTQTLPVTLEQAWAFFSSPQNLATITPGHMRFRIDHISGYHAKMYAGQIIRYKIGILPGLRADWVTEITHVDQPTYFVDEQRVGPYALWHHEHWFQEVTDGVEMTDEVNYGIPFGPVGRLANWLFVEKQLKSIFEYRQKKIADIFSISNPDLTLQS